MTKQVLQYRVCDHCKTDTDAVVTDKVSINGNRFELDLCQKHSDDLHAVMAKWTDPGRQTGKPSVFDEQRQIKGPVVVKAPTREPERKVVFVEDVQPEPVVITRDTPRVPPTAARWRLTAHAVGRMAERGIDEDDARLAAERPETSVTSKRDADCFVRTVGNISVVANPHTFEILTVFYANTPEDAELTAGAR